MDSLCTVHCRRSTLRQHPAHNLTHMNRYGSPHLINRRLTTLPHTRRRPQIYTFYTRYLIDSKSSCRATGTWVRIPPSPFLKYGSTLIFYLAASCNLAAFLLCESPAKRPKDKRTDTPLLCCFISTNSRAFIIVKTSSCLLGEASSQRASISLIVVISFSVSSSCRR